KQRLGRLQHSEIKARAIELLGRLGLVSEANQLPRQLSGGQSQRVVSPARSPTIHYWFWPMRRRKSHTAASVNVPEILKELARRYDRAVIVVTHDRDFAAAVDHVIVMSDGRNLGK